MKPTPYLYVAIGVILVALLCGMGSVLAGVGSYPVDEEKPLTILINDDARQLTDSAELQQSIVSGADGRRVRNPFNLKPEAQRRKMRIPMPPPPRLSSPMPPVLPLETQP